MEQGYAEQNCSKNVPPHGSQLREVERKEKKAEAPSNTPAAATSLMMRHLHRSFILMVGGKKERLTGTRALEIIMKCLQSRNTAVKQAVLDEGCSLRFEFCPTCWGRIPVLCVQRGFRDYFYLMPIGAIFTSAGLPNIDE